MRTSRTLARALRPSWLGWAVLIVAAAAVLCTPGVTNAAVLVDGFMVGYEGWTDTLDAWPTPKGTRSTNPPEYGIYVRTKVLVELGDGRPDDGGGTGTAGGTFGDGTYVPMVMVNKTAMTPATYNLAATLSSTDNDGLGIVFGYQDNDNYFRVGIRQEAEGTVKYGFGTGVSVQKVVGGVITQLHAPNTSFLYDFTNNTPFDLGVSVNGTSYTVNVNGSPLFSGSDANLQAGYYGILSWGQRGNAPYLGTQLHSMTVSSATLNKTHTFESGWPAAWKPMTMYNSVSATGTGADDVGNFYLDFRNGTIKQNTNGYENASPESAIVPANCDFTGPSIIVDDPGSQALGDVEMRVRMTNRDNDGIGVLLRVQDSATFPGYYSFYRVNFTAEAIGTGTWRSPQGMSIQKCLMTDTGPVWSELFHDDQTNPLFIYTDRISGSEITATSPAREAIPFDVKAVVVGNKISVQVINDPDGAKTVINYPDVFDNDNPILTGTVGLTVWGSGSAVDNGVIFGGWGGDPDAPLVVEPGTWPEVPVYHPGDANGDGKVNDLDASILAANWQKTGGATWAQADFNGDGNVTDLDASILAANWQYGVGAAVPEPGTLALLVSALAGLAVLWRRK